MDGPTVYTDPQAPGSPQVGDLVVVAECSNPVLNGSMDVLLEANPGVSLVWLVADRRDGVPYWCLAVRRPTEAELASYHLAHGGPRGA